MRVCKVFCIDIQTSVFFSPVNQHQIRVWYLSKSTPNARMAFGGDDMLIYLCRSYGTQEGGPHFFYKHFVPTGLKNVLQKL